MHKEWYVSVTPALRKWKQKVSQLHIKDQASLDYMKHRERKEEERR